MDSALYNVIGNVKIPKMARVRQKFDPSEITDPAAGIRGELSRPEIAATLKPGMNIAITAGSRGIHNHKLILKTVVDIVKEHGANPFVVPAMGSHGGATAQGQLEVLEGFGITPAYLGCPIKSGMETVRIQEHGATRPHVCQCHPGKLPHLIRSGNRGERLQPHLHAKGAHSRGNSRKRAGAAGIGPLTDAADSL